MNNDLSLFIPNSLHRTHASLDGELRKLIDITLLSSEDDRAHQIAILTLKILAKTSSSDPSFNKLKERFFVNYARNVNEQVKSTLQRVFEIAEKGFFEDFLNQVDSKKQTYPTPSEVKINIDKFYDHTLPLLIKQRNSKNDVSQSEKSSKDGASVKEYNTLMICQKFYLFPKMAKHFLTLLPFRNKWKDEVYQYLFDSLATTYSSRLSDIEKLEIAKLVFRHHDPLKMESFVHCSEIDIKELIELCIQLRQFAGEEVLDFIFSSAKSHGVSSIDEILRVGNLLLIRLRMPKFTAFVDQWQQQALDWNRMIELLEADLVKHGLTVPEIIEDINETIKRFAKDPTVVRPLSAEELKLIHKQYLEIQRLCEQYSHMPFNQLINQAHKIRSTALREKIKEEDFLRLIALGRLAIRLEFGIYPYSTQILALLGVFVKTKSCQAQVKTGEGKSTIVTLWAFERAMECRTPDIITSARYLAIRDQLKAANFFKRCGISSAHICYDDKRPEHFKAQILYGPSFDFEFAWMQDMLWGTKLFQARLKVPFVSRNFDVACVDESDNLLIDTARNGARLSSPAEVSYDWVYAPILSFMSINKDVESEAKLTIIKKLRKYLAEHVSESHQKKCTTLTDDQLHAWLESAGQALYKKKENVDYVIRSSRDDEGRLVREVQIVSIDTGRISERNRWSGGLHEFLEVKHDITVEKESITPITLSHAVFYGFYQTITALTGTAERFQTKEIYGIESFDVPPHLPLKRIDLPPIIARDTAHYYELIETHTRKYQSLKRPLLILCRTIHDTVQLAKRKESAKIEFKLLNEMQEEHESAVVALAGRAGNITIATNTAGRGTDIILSKESIQNMGLHVMPTSRFASKREEDQGIGRAGRQGQPGSSQSILNRDDPEIQELISSQDENLSDEKLIHLLDMQRELREKSSARMNVGYAELERFLARKTEIYFTLFRKWADYVDQDVVLGTWAEKLNSIKLTSRQGFKFDSLSEADRELASECERLLRGKSEILEWKILLKKVVERMKQQAIVQWVKNFFEPAENKLRTISTVAIQARMHVEEAFIQLKDLCNEQRDGYLLFDLLGKHYVASLDASVEATKQEITKQFDAYKSRWEILLAENGLGIFEYLREITTINLRSKV